ncbi:hypothetical protein [Sporosarcina sp. P25]|uniref:hypothetical protein n=1 Tax=unclassified Sporosarcina TaxID=2647733 RepID=UPI003515BB6C
MGLSTEANINPEKTYPSTFEPIHGSAPNYCRLTYRGRIRCLRFDQLTKCLISSG